MELSGLDRRLDGARLWGLELDTKFRVLATTLEVDPDVSGWDLGEDPRIQLLVFPVSTILASLRRHTEDAATLATFEVEQLIEVASAFGGIPVTPPLFGRPEPRPGEWGPRFSLEGRSTAPDGRRGTLTVAVTDDDARLDVFARFDEVEVKDAAGASLTW